MNERSMRAFSEICNNEEKNKASLRARRSCGPRVAKMREIVVGESD
jgi:hypothetical protein